VILSPTTFHVVPSPTVVMIGVVVDCCIGLLGMCVMKEA